jgi:exodeoxyribonuclease VII small subunit
MPGPSEAEETFETAVNQVEKIVESLERGEPDLAVALARYETGVRLLNQCYGLLERAERAVALLTGVDVEGNPITVPFDATATEQNEKAAPAAKPGRTSRIQKSAPEAEPPPDPADPPF